MPGLFGRISMVIKARISRLLDRAEDPAETLDYAYEREIQNLFEVRRGIADVVTAKKRLQMHEAQLSQRADKLGGQARAALTQGREDLARVALERRQLIVEEAGSLDQQITELQSEQEKLIAAEQQLRRKIEQFRARKEVIKAQYSAAEAQVRISEAATGMSGEMADAGLAMQRAIDRTAEMKARADAVQELEAAGTFDDLTALGPGMDDIDRQLAKLGAGPIDIELARLKAELGRGSGAEQGRELGHGSEPPQLGAG